MNRLLLILTILTILSFNKTNAQISYAEYNNIGSEASNLNDIAGQTFRQNITDENISMVGRWAEGPCNTVFIDDNYAYIGNGSVLEILDISDPQSAVEVGRLMTPSIIMDIEVHNNLAYIANWESGLRIVDVSAPSSPFEKGFFDTQGRAQSVFLKSDLAYVADWNDGLRIIDISNSSSPKEIGFFNNSSNAIDVYVTDDFAYIAYDYNGMRVLDISKPYSPTEVGAVSTSDEAVGIFVNEDYAYVSNWNDGLWIIDISSPSNPEVIWKSSKILVEDVFVTDNILYIVSGGNISGGGGYGSITLYDIRYPNNPTLLSSGHTGQGDYRPVEIFVTGNIAYMACESGGLQSIDVSDPQDTNFKYFQEVFTTAGFAFDAYVSGQYAFVADSRGGLIIIDIQNLNNPFEVEKIILADCKVKSVSIKGNYAFIGTSYGGYIYNINDPSNPIYVSQFESSNNICDIAILDDHMYCAIKGYGLKVYNVSSASSPLKICGFSTNWVNGLFVSENFVYVADSDKGLKIIDISQPEIPVLAGSIDTKGVAVDVDVADNYAYVADGDSRVIIIDVTDPADPVEIASYQTNGFVHDIKISDNYAYIGEGKMVLLFLMYPIL